MTDFDGAPIDWRRMTSLAVKAELYREDSFFREGLADCRGRWGALAPDVLHRTALLMFKPDAIGGRRVRMALGFLAERGLAPVAVTTHAYSAPLYHGLYRYQLRRGTLDKVRLYTRWASGLPYVLVAFRDRDPSPGIPASIRFKTMKGHARVEQRKPGDLRTLLASPNSIANFIHAADEPADTVREIPVCVPAAGRAAFLDAMSGEDFQTAGRRLDAALVEAERLLPPHDADPAAAAHRLWSLAETVRVDGTGADGTGADGTGADGAVAMIERCLAGGYRLDLRAFEAAMGAALDRADPLDLFVFASHYIARDLPGERGEIDEDCAVGWLSAADEGS
ncbi:MAG: hypothetical protein NXI16_04125 [Alphaproteobacteria bacterium]|nr:hypothetical protein [Alphaproteobacteria bacterium]